MMKLNRAIALRISNLMVKNKISSQYQLKDAVPGNIKRKT